MLTGSAAHHLARVLRARPGQLYELCDQGELWLARITGVKPQRVEFELLEKLGPAQEAPRLVLLAAVIKFARFEWFLEKATELGVTEIVPVAAQRSQPRLVEAAAKRVPRWEKILHAAAQQARRLQVPYLRSVTPLSEALVGPTCEARILLSAGESVPPIGAVLHALPQAIRSAALAVGPEGGWTDDEVQAARRAGFMEASLGKNILRSETAVVAALAILHYELSASLG
mgnify:CR=1 FL=1